MRRILFGAMIALTLMPQAPSPKRVVAPAVVASVEYPERAIPLPRKYNRPLDVPEVIEAAAVEFGQDPSRMLRVAVCESSLRPAVVGDGGEALGLYQFHLPIWGELAPRLGYVGDLRADPVAASRVAAYAFSIGRANAWTCR